MVNSNVNIFNVYKLQRLAGCLILTHVLQIREDIYNDLT